MCTLIQNARLILPEGIKDGVNLYFKDGRISAITDETLPFDELIDADTRAHHGLCGQGRAKGRLTRRSRVF